MWLQGESTDKEEEGLIYLVNSAGFIHALAWLAPREGQEDKMILIVISSIKGTVSRDRDDIWLVKCASLMK
jgi:hypothetical protein